MAGVSVRSAPYEASSVAGSPPIEMTRIGPWCAGDSRAYHQPTAAEEATATKKSAMMIAACHRRMALAGA